MKQMIYLDNAATEKVFENALSVAAKYSRELYFNPSGGASGSLAVNRDIGGARETLAGILGCAKNEIIFTSGATEANNLVLRGAAKRRGARVIISEGEHASIYNTAKTLSDKFDVRIIPLKAQGQVDGEKLIDAVDENTALVSLIHVNNETGAVNDICALAKAVKGKNKNCLFHSDGVQAFCKIGFALPPETDFYTVSAHKIGGLKGTGALFVRNGMKPNPIITGGKQENGLRAGTENVTGIMSFGAAAYERFAGVEKNFQNAAEINRIFVKTLSSIDNISFNGDYNSALRTPNAKLNCSPYIMSVSIKGVKAETLAAVLDEKGVIVGLGSACSAARSDNRVLASMNVKKAFIDGSIRLSFSNETTARDAEIAAGVIVATVKELRR